MSEPRTILVVDDDRTFADRLTRAFADRGWQAHTAYSVAGGRAEGLRCTPDVAVIDLKMHDGSGLELLKALREDVPDVEVILLTGYGSVATAVDAIRLGARNYVAKPAHADMILAALERGRAEPLLPPEPTYEAPSLARTEWEHIQRVLADCDGNVSKAARVLGVHRRTLQRKLNTDPPSK